MPELTELPEVPELDPAVARDWIERWDRQQEVYVAEREDRFTALIDVVEAGAGRPDPLVLDLGCGPGSLAVRLLRRLPEATVIAVDADPVTLNLGRAAYGGMRGLRFTDADLRNPGWAGRIGLQPGQRFDAAVSTTALHWLSPAELTSLYATLAGLVKPGGLFLDGDHFRLDEAASPVLARLDRALEEKESQRRFPTGTSAAPRTGNSGGVRPQAMRNWPVRHRNESSVVSATTARKASSSPCTPRHCAPPGSPRSARSGSAAPVAFSPPFDSSSRAGPAER
jgi:SAM-dependent methyltransferase